MSVLMPQQLLSAGLEAAINQAIALHQGSCLPLNELNQKSLAISLQELNFTLVIEFIAGEALVGSNKENCTCHIITSLKTLVALKEHQQLTALIKADKLDIDGDLKTAQQFVSLFEQINIDWPSEIAKHIGDIPTYKLSQVAKNIAGKITFATQQIQADMSEYIVYEQKLVVNASELARFSQQVTGLDRQTNEVVERLRQLEYAIQSKAAE